MGNTSSAVTGSSSGKSSGSSGKKGSRSSKSGNVAASAAESATERAKKVFGDVQESFKIGVKKLEEQDHPAAHLIDSVCGPYFDSSATSTNAKSTSRKMREDRSGSFYSEDIDSDDSRTISEDEQTMTTLDTDYNASTTHGSTLPPSATRPPKPSRKDHMPSSMDSSYFSQSDYESEVGAAVVGTQRGRRKKRDKRRSDDPSMNSDEEDIKHATENNSATGQAPAQLLSKPLASSFAKRCYFTKAGIGKTTQHYEGLTLTGNVVLMLAAAMKLKGCPTICDEDLRRVEQTYPNQFSRLPDELLLSSGWRRISKYCHFSNKPIPDGIPFFHSKQRLHPQGGYYFLLAAAVGMVRPIDVEPLTRDTLVLLETDYPAQCDSAPEILIQDPNEWTLVDKFCFFSGGPINTEEDVYYQADFDGNPIYMLAFLSPSLTPEELYKLEGDDEVDEHGNPIPGLTSVAAVKDVESVYDLTERDFHDLKLYHLGPCRALPQYILQPQAWTKVLPPHFLAARHRAVLRAQDYEMAHGGPVTPLARDMMMPLSQHLTVGATPLDARYGDYHAHAENPDQHLPPYDEPPDHNPQENGGYYMHPSPRDQGFSSEYELVGNVYSPTMMAYNNSANHQFEKSPQYQDEQQHYQQQNYAHASPSPRMTTSPLSHPSQHSQPYPHSFPSPQGSQKYDYQDDERSNNSQDFQREAEEEGAFADDHNAPLDEAMGTRMHHHGMDPPEDLPADEDLDGSVVVSEVPNVQNTSNGTYYSHQQGDTLEVSKSESQYSNELNSPSVGERGDVPWYGGQEGTPQYSYSVTPDKDDYYDQEQSRDEQYYDSPDVLKNQAGSQDHEFFNAVSGGGEDEEDYEPSYVSSFDPQGHLGRHPDDHHYSQDVGYYDEEEDLQEQSSQEYSNHRREASPSPIRVDHLRQLSRHKQQQSPSPRRAGSVMASPMSQASSQNSISEYSHSSAMRGAQELLKRNRRRRHEQARRRLNQQVRLNDSMETDGSAQKLPTHYAFAPDENYRENGIQERGCDDGSASWETANSETLTSVISGSSVWTDNSSNPADRSSRRALILQMAKARMKSNKERDPAEKTIKEEKSGSLGDSHSREGYGDDHRSRRREDMNELTAPELDFAADLD